MSENMNAGESFTTLLSGGVLVAGAGVSGLGTAKLLHNAGVSFAVADDDAAKLAGVQKETGCRTMDTAEAARRASDFPLVVTSPGWRPDSALLLAASDAGCAVIGDVELCYLLDQHSFFGPPRDWLVVTGTNGKTTTTGMLAAIMEEASTYTGKRAAACGNIGIAVADALTQAPRIDVLVAELSSFQLHWSHELTPDAGVLLNLADDHIDWHGSFDAYAEAKAKVFTSSTAVAGVDDEQVVRFAAQTGRSDIIGFTLHEPGDNQVGVVDGHIVSRIGGTPTRISLTDGIEPAGEAGVLDALAATAVAVTRGASPEQIDRALHSYQVSGHRGAVVHRANGVDWIDNSKATNPHAADSALNGTEGKIVWVAGGQLKGADVDELVRDHAHQFRAVALLGVDRDVIAGAVDKHAPDVNVFVTESSDPVDAMNDVVRFASEQAKVGDSVILAPAASSLDMYSGMAQRGNLFADAARALAENGTP
nr:UDP-N-acetylmuramoyl-L-alanyl-D-glutamate synthetase [Streptococcus thermophilus]